MSELRLAHPDELVLLRYAAEELSSEERFDVEQHTVSCAPCARRLQQTLVLNDALLEAAAGGDLRDAGPEPELPKNDPFRTRPDYPFAPLRSADGAGRLAAVAREASERSAELRVRIREAATDIRGLGDLLGTLSFDDPAVRYALLYALQDSGREIGTAPVAALRFAELVLKRLRSPSIGTTNGPEVEMLVPLISLRGQAHLLAGQACNWTSEFEQAKTHLRLAYRSFGRAGGDEVGLAIVEHVEAQRRFLLNKGAEALVLARRAKESFVSLGLEDLSAKADVLVGGALSRLGREEEALPLLSAALQFFERRAIWGNYVPTLNNFATCLRKVGRLDEARREYAKALRRLAREPNRTYLSYIRYGLAEVLFAAGRYRDAAGSFSQAARLCEDSRLTQASLTASLFEIESWARSGDPGRARHRLEIFEARMAELGGVDSNVLRAIETALEGATPNLESLSELRQRAETAVYDRLRLSSA
jgi:tetratricopeptide (TPR) repeat protein